MELTQEIRDAAKQEHEAGQQKSKMSVEQAARLRSIKEEERLNKIGEGRFATALTSVADTSENLQKLIARCSGDSNRLERRAYKLQHWIQAKGKRLGIEITRPEDIVLLSNLTSDEERMPDSSFESEWRVRKAFIRPEPEVKICALGSKCLRSYKRKGAVVTGTGLYCSDNCRATAIALKKRSKAVAQNPEVTAIAS